MPEKHEHNLYPPSEVTVMNTHDPKSTNAAATLPAKAKVGEWLFLNGDNVNVKALLCSLRFDSTDGQTGFGRAFQRGSCNEIFFQVIAPMVGTMKVTGTYHADSTEPNREYGTIVITP